jgi:glyoxylase-like metal-dependent hydrolase (beta-lactamase superfamily II)
MKRAGGVAAVVVLLLGIAAIYGYGSVTSLEAQPVSGDVHVLMGLGGNVGVLKTGDGAVVVDTMTFRVQGQRIRERAERLAGPVQAVINTHYHLDHSHGNPGFAPGTRVVATRRTLEHMETFDADFWSGPAAETLPNDVFEQSHELRIGGKTIRAVHLGRGHTDGDLVVLFVEDRVLHTGDLVFNHRYPNIDLEAGGSVRAWIDTLDRVMALDFDVVIPGHGAVTDRAGIEAYQDFLRQLWAVGETAAREGRSLAETLQTADLTADAGYEEIGVPLVFRLDREFVLRRVWEEATRAVKPPAGEAGRM